MLKSPNRPRAPSAATLRVLYQLAYISSGTAVGIGALCAEERRRRTQIVQRVADNAKRIRQSPRYAHGAAAAAVRKEHSEENFGWFGEETEVESSRHFEAERGKARRLENHEGAKMPELPSVVAEEYGLLIERNGKSSRRRTRTGRPDFVEEHGNREPTVKAEPDGRGKEQARPSFIRPMLSKPTPAHLETLESTTGSKDFKRTSMQWISYTRPSRYGIATGELEATSRRTELFHDTKQGQNYRNPNANYEQTINSFGTHRLWARQDDHSRTLSPEILAQDVDMFFEKVGADAFPRMPLQHARSIADGLLRLSLESGSNEQIRSLLLWKQAAGSLRMEDLHSTVASFRRIAESSDPESTIHFYTDLFALPKYGQMPRAEKLRINLKLRAEELQLDTLDEDSGLYRRLTDNKSALSRLCQIAQAPKILEQECRQLIDDGHLPPAIKLWCMVVSSRHQYMSNLEATLDNDLFDAAMKARHLSLCAQMLRAKNQGCSEEFSSHQKDALIKVCFEEGAVGILQSLFGSADAGGLRDNSMLNPESYACLCRCFAGTNERFGMFNTYYRRLPLELRSSVAEASVNDAAFALKADWKATRNLDLVREKYERTLERLSQDVEVDARPLEVAMIEIELRANQPAEAIAALSIMNKLRTDGSVVTLIALALAKQKNWFAFGRLFETLKQDRPTWNWTPTMKRAYNNALHLFSRSHTAEQLSDFVSMSINELRLRPNQSTWEILLSSLVSKRAIALLKYWIKLSGTSGKRLDMDDKFAAALMKSWYLDFRHSHVLVMWLCRNLVEAAPSLQGRALLDIAREAIGFDLRKLRGVNAPWMGPILRAREALCQDTNGTVPKPGYIWNGRLYDSGRLVTVEDLLAQRQASLADDDPHTLLDPETTAAARERATDLHTSDELQTLLDSRTTATVRERGTDSVVETGIPHFEPASDATDQSKVKSARVLESSEAPVIRNVAPMQEGDATTTSTSQPIASLENLRPLYEAELSGLQESDTATETTEPEPLERRMIIKFSLRQYDSVLKLYQESLDAIGLPASPMVLEVALEASLRSSDDRSEAERIVSAARDAGMNVTCAMGPLLINQISNTPLNDMTSATALRSDVLEYYRSNELNGLHVKHHVATHAAHKLIQAGFAQHGINLLSTILKSSWFIEKPLDIAAMSVWLSGYAALGHVQGMHWVIEEVLNQGLGIDQVFLQSLKSARRPVRRYDNGTLGFGRQERKTIAYIRQWFSVCSQRRLAQMQESKVFGRKLVNLLASAANGESVRTTARGRRRVFKRNKPERPSRTGLAFDPFVENTVDTVWVPTTDEAKEKMRSKPDQTQPAAAEPAFDLWALAADETKEKTTAEPASAPWALSADETGEKITARPDKAESPVTESTGARWMHWVGETK